MSSTFESEDNKDSSPVLRIDIEEAGVRRTNVGNGKVETNLYDRYSSHSGSSDDSDGHPRRAHNCDNDRQGCGKTILHYCDSCNKPVFKNVKGHHNEGVSVMGLMLFVAVSVVLIILALIKAWRVIKDDLFGDKVDKELEAFVDDN